MKLTEHFFRSIYHSKHKSEVFLKEFFSKFEDFVK